MKHASVATLVLSVLFLAFVFVPVLSWAQESDISSAWLKGTWRGISPSPAYGDDRREYVFAENGTFKGDIQSVRGGLIDISGSYRIEGGSKLTLEGIYKNGPRILFGSKFEVYLTRNGERLEGENYSYATGKRFPISLQRVK